MPTFTYDDPLSTGLGAAAAYAQQKQQTAIQAQARQDALNQLALDNAARNRQLTDEETQAAQAHKLQNDQVWQSMHSQQAADKIAAAQAARDAALFPLVKKYQLGQIQSLDVQRQADLVNLRIAKQFGVPLAQLQVEQGQAAVNLTNAEAYREMHPATGSGGIVTGVPGVSNDPVSIFSSMSKRAQNIFMAMQAGPHSTNPDPSLPETGIDPMKALQIINADTSLSSRDKTLMRALMSAGSYNPAAAPKPVKPPFDAKGEWDAIQSTKGMKALAPNLRAMVEHVLVDQGMSIQDAINTLPQSGLSQDDQDAIRNALTQPPQ